MSTPEAKVKMKVKNILNSYGAYYAMPAGTGFGRSGIPDFLVCYKGHFIGIECKANGNRPTVLQEHELLAIRRAKGATLVIDEFNQHYLIELLEGFKDAT